MHRHGRAQRTVAGQAARRGGGGEKVRLVLNASESRSTATSRFVRAYTGAGVRHVAFGTTDIVRVAEHLAASQVRRLSLPANDYDDLSARWNLDDQILNALQRHRLLYDRDAVGEFHHLCTGTFRIASSSRPCSAAALTLDSEPRTPRSGRRPRRVSIRSQPICCNREDPDHGAAT
jgi:hypothetical protein